MCTRWRSVASRVLQRTSAREKESNDNQKTHKLMSLLRFHTTGLHSESHNTSAGDKTKAGAAHPRDPKDFRWH